MEKPAKRERGKNFTEQEKISLAKIVEKYAQIIENKKTDGTTIKSKVEAWEAISTEFNACSVGDQLRTGAQLKHLYGNMKRQVRSDLAESHKRKYLTEKEESGDLKLFQKQATQDKKELYKTGGGTFVPQLSEAGAQVLAIISEQVTPIENLYDDYFMMNMDNPNEHESENLFLMPQSPSHPAPSTAIPEATPELPSVSHQRKMKNRKPIKSFKRKSLKKMTTEELKKSTITTKHEQAVESLL